MIALPVFAEVAPAEPPPPSPVELPKAERCSPAWVGLDRLLLTSAKAQHEAGHHAEAFALCADVVALARDEDLAGGLTDLLLANAELQHMVQACRPMLGQAPPEASARFAQALAALRPTFPANLEAVLRRDHAEQVLYTFGKGRDPTQPLGCERAGWLAAAREGRPLTRSDRVDLERAWQASRKSGSAPNDTFLEAYDLTLRLLDSLVAQARGR